jgi:hypothetical protein
MQSIILQPQTAVQLKWLQDLAKMLKISFTVVNEKDETNMQNCKTHTAKRKTGLDEALDDLKCGRVSPAFSSVDELFKSLND